MDTIPAKMLLSPYHKESGWFGCNYNINIYKGCCHGCIYCDSRSDCYGIENFDKVRIKAHALNILEHELRSKKKSGIVGIGAMSDSYNPFEKELCVTRGALKLFDRYRFGVHLDTKSSLVIRDIDILCAIKAHSPVSVNFTVTTFDDDLASKLEPNAPLSSKRFAALKALSQSGITCGVLLMPILPFINDTAENISAIVKAAYENGAKYIFCMNSIGVTLRANQREYFLKMADKLFPGISKKYIDTFGESYICESPKQASLLKLFINECKKYSIAYTMPDIIDIIKADYSDPQLTLF